MAIVDERLSYEPLTEAEQRGVLLVLSHFPDHYEDVKRIRLAVALPGKLVLNTCEALILAGIIRPYYYWIADRLESHPAIKRWEGIPQAYVDAFKD